MEFPAGDRSRRFQAAKSAESNSFARDAGCHREALDSYFRTHPYFSWFDSFEPLLNGLGASYYGDYPSAPLHTNFCSPVATYPSWPRLSKPQRILLERKGIPLWHALVEALEPDVVLVSCAGQYLERIEFPSVAPPRLLWTSDRTPSYQVWGTRHTISSSKSCLIVFGRARSRPFGVVSRTHRMMVGAAVLESYRVQALGPLTRTG